MDSRTSKYYELEENNSDVIPSRSSRNSRLYREVYGENGEFDNIPVTDNANEIDIDSLRELVSSSNKKEASREKANLSVLETRKRDIDETKVHDINKLLEKAKYENNKLKGNDHKKISVNRDILSTLGTTELSLDEIREACRKYEESINKDNKNEKSDKSDLTMTREMKYFTRQLSKDPLVEQVVTEDDSDLSLDLLSDLKPTGDTIVTEPIKEEIEEEPELRLPSGTTEKLNKPFFELKENTSDIDVIKEDKKYDTDFFTSSHQFSKRDFTGGDDDDYEESNVGNVIKILLLILSIIIFAGVIVYFVFNYGIGA